MDRRRALLSANKRESISLGDVAYYNGNVVKTCHYDDYETSMGTAIGVVVIPEGFAPDGKARIIGLKPMDTAGNMTNSHVGMIWSRSYIDTALTNYQMVPITDNTNAVSSGVANVGYLPSDKFTGYPSYVDPKANYRGTSGRIPSPYLGDRSNPDYYKKILGGNVLSNFSGLTNTQILVNFGLEYVAANACWNYNDGTNSNVQWYLPATGELGYIMVRFKEINNVIKALGGVAIDGDSDFWSSSEFNNGADAYSLYTGNGNVSTYSKGYDLYTRAFAIID